MKTKMYGLFRECFPQFPVPEDIFYRLIGADECEFVTHYEHGELAGGAAVRDNNILLLCVPEKYRGKGIGSKLLRECEKIISINGFDEAVLGGESSDLFIGAVTPREQWFARRNLFFEREGYTAGNGCFEMEMPLKYFDRSTVFVPPCPADVTFGYAEESDRKSVLAAVEKVDPDWLEYFDFESPVFIAKKDGRTVGFCIIDENADTVLSTGGNNVGMAGCVGIIPEMRRMGIGLELVTRATEELKNRGCDISYIHYTHLEWWYTKLGYRTFLHLWFGKKKL